MKIALLGDIAFYGKFSVNNNDIFDYFSEVAENLKQYDYVIGNLETPLYDYDNHFGHKSAYIKSDTKNIDLLKYLNINIVNLSNNHIFDYGISGYNSTKKALQENGIHYFGIENKKHFINESNNKIALSGYCCYSTNGLGYYNKKTKIGVNILNGFEIENDLIESRNNGYLNITSFHCGQEHVNYPNYDHIKMARKLASKVPYVFYGHHPHVMQGIEKENDSLIAYSLGNFCFDDVYTNKSKEPLIKQTKENKKSFILVLQIENNKILNYETIPLFADEDKMNIGVNLDIVEDLDRYSSYLKLDESEYIFKRQELINNYLNNRKAKRDLYWYIKRLNFKSIGIIKDLYENKKKYEQYVKEYIK
ncbi:CapA family protein [Ureibacillus composti]